MKSYEVQAKLTAVDDASKTIKALNKAYASLARTQQKLNAASSGLGVAGKSSLPKQVDISRVNKGLSTLNKTKDAGIKQNMRIVADVNRVTNAYNAQARAIADVNKQAIKMGAIKQHEPRQLHNQNDNPRRRRNWSESTAVDRIKWRAGAEATYRSFDKIGVGTRAAGQGIVSGDTQRTLNRIALNDPKQQKKLEDESLKSSSQYRMVGQADLMEIGREAIGNLKNADEFPAAMASLAKTTQALALQYGDAKKGADAALKAYKAADVSGFADSAEEQKKFLDAYAKQSILSGKDLSPELAKNAFKKMGNLRQGLNENGIAEVILAVDEFQGDAGAVFRQFNRTLTAADVAKNKKDKMQGAGLRDKDGAVDATLLKQNPFDWVQKHIAPKMEKAGIDLSNVTAETSANIERELNKIGIIGESQKYASYAISKGDEIKRARAKRDKMDFSDKTIRELPDKSIVAANTAAASQFKNAADELTKSLQPLYSKTIGGLSSGLNNIATSKELPTGLAAALAVPILGLQAVLKNGDEGINNKLMVSNALLGKIALSQSSLGGAGKVADIAKKGAVGSTVSLLLNPATLVTAGGIMAASFAKGIVEKSPEYFLPKDEKGNVKIDVTTGGDDTTIAAAILHGDKGKQAAELDKMMVKFKAGQTSLMERVLFSLDDAKLKEWENGKASKKSRAELSSIDGMDEGEKIILEKRKLQLAALKGREGDVYSENAPDVSSLNKDDRTLAGKGADIAKASIEPMARQIVESHINGAKSIATSLDQTWKSSQAVWQSIGIDNQTKLADGGAKAGDNIASKMVGIGESIGNTIKSIIESAVIKPPKISGSAPSMNSPM